jgi:cathepsin B
MRFLFAALAAVASIVGSEAMTAYPLHEVAHAVNRANTTWRAGINARWVGKDMNYIKRQMGTILPTPIERKLAVKTILDEDLDVEAIPDSFDARTAWPSCPSISEIRDQSNCGSCWAFGAVEAATDRICISTNGATKTHLSAQDLLSCCSSCGFGCSGGYPASAWSWFTQTGVVTGGNYADYSFCSSYSLPNCDHHVSGKYPACAGDASTPSCPTSCDSQSKYPTAYGSDKHTFATSYSIPNNVAQIQQEIMTNGPVEGAFTVYADFPTYKSGVYIHTTGDELGGHAIRILGWGTESGVDYWLVANSWNNDWGNNGFFKIRRGTDECGIEDEIVAGLYKSS